VQLCVVYGSQNNQRLLFYTALIAFYNWDILFTVRYELGI